MDTRYDAVVVGSGLGGLAAAAKLAHEGLSVRLLERHIQPGGYATTFFRAPFEFEVSLHALSGIGTPGNRGPLWPLLLELGITERVEFRPIESFYRTVADGFDLQVPCERQETLRVLCDAFPHERRGLTRVMDRLFAVRAEVQKMSANGGVPSVLGTITRYPMLAHAAAVPLGSVLHREIADPLARLTLAQTWGYYGLPPSQLSMLYFGAATTSFLSFGGCYPVGKSQALSNAFVSAIERAGGTVSLGDGARRIVVRAGRAEGVVTDAGEHIRAEVVISNANPFTTIWDLVGPEHFSDDYRRRVTSSTPSLSIFTVYLGLSRTVSELGIVDHETFVNGTVDMDQQYAAAFRLAPPDFFLVTGYNLTDPGFSPPGTAVLAISCLVDGDTWAAVPPGEYAELKQRWTTSLVEQASRRFPGLRDCVQVAVAATPITMMRYTGNTAGAIYGFAATPAQNPAFRLERKTPIEGLWLAGAWTQPGGGYEPCIGSGYDTATAVLDGLGIHANNASLATG